jgi:hypothetical protein
VTGRWMLGCLSSRAAQSINKDLTLLLQIFFNVAPAAMRYLK